VLTFIVIVNWNGRELLYRCLSSLLANTRDAKVIVVDNASIDGSADMVQQNFPHVKLIRNAVNAGFSRANNQGIRYALQRDAKYVLLLNSDVEVTGRNWLEEFIRVIESDSRIGIAGCKLLFADGLIQHGGGLIELNVPRHRGEYEKDRGQYDKVELVDYVTGAALMIKSEIIRKIGLLDEGFTPLYYEDTDWCVRAKLYGYNIVYTPKPALIHHCGASSSKLGEQRKAYYANRSFIRFMLLNYPAVSIVKWLVLFESKQAIRCIIVKPALYKGGGVHSERPRQQGKLPLTLRADASSCLLLRIRVWQPSIRGLKEIIFLRRQRFMLGRKLNL
jgi:GT2 family glycosyltransferase